MKTLYSFRNIDISDGRRAADGQHAIDAIFHVPGFDGSHFHQPENLFGTLVKSKPRLCQGEAACIPVNQLHTQFFLQQLELVTQGRLGDMQSLGSPADLSFLGNGAKISQLANIHLAPPIYI